MGKKISCLLLYIFTLMSCSTVKQSTIDHKERKLTIDPATVIATAGTSSIKLLDHQLLPIDYLLKNPDQKGLLVNHYMGTEKTFLGLGFAQAFRSRPVIILAPQFLRG